MNFSLVLIIIIITLALMEPAYKFLCSKFNIRRIDKLLKVTFFVLLLLPIIYTFANYTPNSNSNTDIRTWGEKPKSEWTNKDMQDYIDWNVKQEQKEWENRKINEL